MSQPEIEVSVFLDEECGPHGFVRCGGCGDIVSVGPPMDFDSMEDYIDAFTEKHQACF